LIGTLWFYIVSETHGMVPPYQYCIDGVAVHFLAYEVRSMLEVDADTPVIFERKQMGRKTLRVQGLAMAIE
jgi:hypothetical protein